ncbi:hypothetical protein STVA_15470 [Allostella vacuolata]|nr:hypothetical protein STVA_15470 [Stella vacuolata]
MSQVIVGRWGKNLAVRIPLDIANASRLSEGESVELETQDGDILIRRVSERARRQADAEAAAAEIIEESRHYSLGGIPVRELIDEGRRE